MNRGHFHPLAGTNPIVNPERSVAHAGHDTTERALQGLKPLAQLRVEDYDTFVAKHPRFVVSADNSYN